MAKTNDIASLVKELRTKAKEIVDLADAVEGIISGTDEKPAKKAPAKAAEEKPAEEEIKLPDIKALLMEKSRAGYDTEVHDLITSFGVKKLSEIDPANYPELKKKAEVIGNA